MSAFRKVDGLIVRTPGGFRIVEEPVAQSEPLPDVGVGEQAPVLRVARKFDRLARTVLSAPCVSRRFRIITNFFFYSRVFNHAVEQARARHQNAIALLFSQAEGNSPFPFGEVQISIVEMQISVVQVYAPEPMMIAVLLINRCSLVEFGQGLFAQLRKAAPVLRFVLVLLTTPLSGRFSPPRSIGVNLPEKLQGYQPFC